MYENPYKSPEAEGTNAQRQRSWLWRFTWLDVLAVVAVLTVIALMFLIPVVKVP